MEAAGGIDEARCAWSGEEWKLERGGIVGEEVATGEDEPEATLPSRVAGRVSSTEACMTTRFDARGGETSGRGAGCGARQRRQENEED